MSRIVGGVAGGRRIEVPRGRDTRPTAERVREGLFSALEAMLGGLTGSALLDLYAGSGAVGLEAASRGASRVTLVESSSTALRSLRANVAALGLPGVEVRGEPVARMLASEPLAAYDVVFLDPPYADPVGEVLAAVLGGGWVGAGGVVVAERATRGPDVEWPEGLVQDRVRRYGDTTLWYGRRP